MMAKSPPYPPDTRAKGWRFELDHERIRQSDTWALASPEVRPWLLMLWLVAWEQVPCGSLPDDDELIAVRLGMSAGQFSGVKKMIMRGWWKADDGRLYHGTMTERVMDMIDKKNKETNRKQKYRERMQAIRDAKKMADCPASVPRDSTGTDAGATRERRHQNQNQNQNQNNIPVAGDVLKPATGLQFEDFEDQAPPPATAVQFQKFRMTPDWQPPATLDDCCTAVGFDRSQITPEVIGEFRMHFAGEGSQRAEIQWCNTLIKSTKRMLAMGIHPDQLRIKQAGGEPQGFIARHTDRRWRQNETGEDFIARVTDRSWADGL